MSISDSIEPLLNYAETAKILRVDVRTLRTMVSDGDLPVVRFRGTVRFDPVDVRRFIESSKRGTPPSGEGPSPPATNPAFPPPESP